MKKNTLISNEQRAMGNEQGRICNMQLALKNLYFAIGNKTKLLPIASLLPIACCLLLIIPSCRQKTDKQHEEHEQQQAIYTCSMHSEIIRNEPGKCPVCGMNLVKKGGTEKKITETDISTRKSIRSFFYTCYYNRTE